MSDLIQFEHWKRDFRMEDDGLNAFLSIKKLQEISYIVAMKKEGWIDKLESLLS